VTNKAVMSAVQLASNGALTDRVMADNAMVNIAKFEAKKCKSIPADGRETKENTFAQLKQLMEDVVQRNRL
jgi:hypothetical protein